MEHDFLDTLATLEITEATLKTVINEIEFKSEQDKANKEWLVNLQLVIIGVCDRIKHERSILETQDTAEEPEPPKHYESLLKKITAKYNQKTMDNFHEGLLDFIPSEKTTVDMLVTILVDYAFRNYPEILE